MRHGGMGAARNRFSDAFVGTQAATVTDTGSNRSSLRGQPSDNRETSSARLAKARLSASRGGGKMPPRREPCGPFSFAGAWSEGATTASKSPSGGQASEAWLKELRRAVAEEITAQSENRARRTGPPIRLDATYIARPNGIATSVAHWRQRGDGLRLDGVLDEIFERLAVLERTEARSACHPSPQFRQPHTARAASATAPRRSIATADLETYALGELPLSCAQPLPHKITAAHRRRRIPPDVAAVLEEAAPVRPSNPVRNLSPRRLWL